MSKQIVLNPWFFTGLSDGKAFLIIYVAKNAKYSSGSRVQLGFMIGFNKRDFNLLNKIRVFLII
jgi:hypothetical protein